MRALKGRWPGREHELRLLAAALLGGGPAEAAPAVVVSGPPAGGKSALVRAVLAVSRRPHAVASALDAATPKALYESLLAPLAEAHAAPAPGKCERLADFVAALTDILPVEGANGGAPPAYLVVDEAHRLLEPRRGGGGADAENLVAVLLRLAELTGRNVGVVLVSVPDPSAFRVRSGAPEPVHVHFPPYAPEQLASILERERPAGADAKLYAAFLRSTLGTFGSTCRNLHELRALLGPLWRRYAQPLEEGVLPEPRRLWAALRGADAAARGRPPHLHAGLAVPLSAQALALARGEWPVPAAGAGEGRGGTLDFDLPYLSKLLLLAAFVASRTSPDQDARVADEGGPARKKARRAAPAAVEKRDEHARLLAQMGPKPFGLERLLALFKVVARDAGEQDRRPTGGRLFTADVFMQVSSLVSLGLLTRVSADPLDAGRYACNVSVDLATQLAKNTATPLTKFVTALGS